MNGPYKIVYSVNGNTFNYNLNVGCFNITDQVIPHLKKMSRTGKIYIDFTPELILNEIHDIQGRRLSDYRNLSECETWLNSSMKQDLISLNVQKIDEDDDVDRLDIEKWTC